MGFREWPARRILLLAGGWIIAILALLALLVFGVFVASLDTGSGGVGATSAGVLELLVVLFGPPLVLVLLWLVLRRRAAG
jgi:hypothetical protein